MISLKFTLGLHFGQDDEYNYVKVFPKFDLNGIINISISVWEESGSHRITIFKDDVFFGLIDVWDVSGEEYINMRFKELGIYIDGLHYNNFDICFV